MATPKTPLQNQVNLELKKINPNFKAFTEQEFRTNKYAIELLYMFSDEYFSYCNELTDKMKKYQKLNKDIPYELLNEFTTTHMNLTNKRNSLIKEVVNLTPYNSYEDTAKFFGLPFDGLYNIKLIHKLDNSIYSDVINQNINVDSKNTFQYTNEKLKSIKEYTDCINEWINYCKQLSSYKNYIEKIYPRWSKMTKKEKKVYINELKILREAPFISNTQEIDNYIDFLENYSLNQIPKAKIERLLTYNFVNIDNYKIAKEIYEKTNLIKNGLILTEGFGSSEDKRTP